MQGKLLDFSVLLYLISGGGGPLMKAVLSS